MAICRSLYMKMHKEKWTCVELKRSHAVSCLFISKHRRFCLPFIINLMCTFLRHRYAVRIRNFFIFGAIFIPNSVNAVEQLAFCCEQIEVNVSWNGNERWCICGNKFGTLYAFIIPSRNGKHTFLWFEILLLWMCNRM